MRMGESESFAFPKPEWLSFVLFRIGGGIDTWMSQEVTKWIVNGLVHPNIPHF